MPRAWVLKAATPRDVALFRWSVMLKPPKGFHIPMLCEILGGRWGSHNMANRLLKPHYPELREPL